MTPRTHLSPIRFLALLLLLSGACISCQRGRPTRKKLPPELNSFADLPAQLTPLYLPSGVIFYSSDTTMLIKGLRRNLTVISFFDPDKDSTVRNLIAAGQSLLPGLIAELHRENKTGVVIDLRQEEGNPTIRQDYLVTPHEEQRLPVVFLWDKSSAGRAMTFMGQLERLPDITYSILSSKPQYQQDCFQDNHPDF
jgi:hypothetical protein